MLQLLCSTGTFSRFPDLTDYRSIFTFGSELEVDGFELMFYPDWSANLDHISKALLASELKFPVIHAEKGIIPALLSSKTDEVEQGWQWMHKNCVLGELLGCSLLIFHLWGFPTYDVELERNLFYLKDCIKIAEDYRLKLAIETVPCKYNDPLGNIHRVLDQEPDMLIALDTEFLAMHNQLEAAYQADWLWQRNRVRHIHIKDYDGSGYTSDTARRYLHPGEGSINFLEMFDILKLRQFSGNISLESSIVDQDGSRDISKLKQSLAWLRQLQLHYNTYTI
jgi:sugar phosphate isomerase/epimerase